MNEREALKPCPFCGEQLTVEAETLSLVREALKGIISADWLTWEELADPEEFVRWSKPRVNHALRTLAAQAQEIAELRHDIEHHAKTNAKLAAENERLRQALRHQDDRDGRSQMIPDDVIIRAGTNMLAHTDMVPLEYVRQALAEARKDAERLAFLASEPVVEGFVGDEKDIYDYAFDAAEESGRDEPSDADMLAGLRRMIDAAIDRARGKEQA